ncbi:MAG: hypothetical protein J0H88_08375 [Sphingomonadales bacterium]|nr:hypothetical protein [Sphingomonadales bacterium]
MPALVADVARAMRRATIVESADSAIKATYPHARDGRTSPAAGLFDAASDAQTALDARRSLIGVAGRRRFAVQADAMIWPDLNAGVPVWMLIDAEHDVSSKHLAARLQIDAEEETTTMELFG